jgi:hypothetical protein
MTIRGYYRLADTTHRADYDRQLGINGATQIIREPYDDHDRHHHDLFRRLVNTDSANNDVIMVIKLSHLSEEFCVIARQIKLIADQIVARKNLDFVAVNAGIDTREYSAVDKKLFFDSMSNLAGLHSIYAGNGGGDGGGNGGC